MKASLTVRAVLGASFTLFAAVAAVPAAEAPAPLRARQLMESQQWKRAKALLEAELRAHPNDPAILSAMADFKTEVGEAAEGEKLAKQAVAAAPNDAQAHETLARAYGAQARRAGMLKGLKLAGAFRKEAEQAIALDPKRIESREMMMQFHLQAPGVAGGDKKKAKTYAEEIGRLDPARGELAMADYLVAMKDTNAVEGCLRRAIAKDPQNIEARLDLAGWMAAPHRKRFDEAAEQAKAAIAADPEHAGGHMTLAFVHARAGKWTELDAVLADADARCPDTRGHWYQAGRAMLMDGRELPRAERSFRRYLEAEASPGNPSHAHARWRLAGVLEKEGKKAEAIAELEKAVAMRPDLDEAKKDLKRLKK